MQSLSLAAFVVLVTVLFGKFLFLIGLQGSTRGKSRTFRWVEDATRAGGEVRQPEHPLVERAQAALRNDGESQPFFLIAAGAWVVLGAPGPAALAAFAVYLLARITHTLALIWPRQPLRIRVFGLGQLVTLLVLADALRRVVQRG